jgi:hypothetical protein
LEKIESAWSGASTSTPELGADLRIVIGAHLLGIGALEDRQPGGHAPEHLAVLHREALHDAAGIAERHRANALPGRLLDVRQVLAPSPGVTRLLDEGVVHDRAAAGLGDPAEQVVFQFGVGPAAALDHARAHLAEHVGQREELRLRRAGRGNPRPGDVEVVHVAGDREPEGPRLERLSDHAPHRLELGVRGRTLRAVLAHGVEPDGGVADERADVHAEPLAAEVQRALEIARDDDPVVDAPRTVARAVRAVAGTCGRGPSHLI